MADKRVRTYDPSTGEYFDRLYKDMGDGTFAEVVRAGSSVLPSGAATETTLGLVRAKTDQLDITLSALRDAIVKTGATSKTLADIVTALGSPLQAGGTVTANGGTPPAEAWGVDPQGADEVFDVTLSLDTNAYAINDLLADMQEIGDVARVDGGKVILQSLVVLDLSDQGQGLTLLFSQASTSIGTENAALNMSAANVGNLVGHWTVGAGEFVDLGSGRIATKTGLGLEMMPAADSKKLYVAARSDGAGTYGASGIVLRLGFIRN